MTTSSQNLYSESTIEPASVDQSTLKYYCTETDWRNYSGFTNQNDFPSSEVALHLENASEQIKKDAFHMMRWEMVTKDSSGRYFTQRKYWANRYGTFADGQTQILHGEVAKYDLEVFEADTTSSVASSLWLQGTRLNRLMYKIPYEGVTEIDALNCFFKLDNTKYPTVASRQIFVTYWVLGKPMNELAYELKRACMEMTTILALTKLKTKRLKKGTVEYTLGKQTIVRDERIFDEMLEQHKKAYDSWIRWVRPFIGRRLKIGRMETETSRMFINRY